MDEVDHLFQNLQEGDDIAPTYLWLQKAIKIKQPSLYWYIGNTNVTVQILEYQQCCVNTTNSSGFILEINASEILIRRSSIFLLLKPHQYSPTMMSFYKKEELKLISNRVMTKMCCEHDDDELNIELMSCITV